jgi:hypothetical protein
MKVHQPRLAKGLSMKKRRRHSPEQIVKKLRDAPRVEGVGKQVESVHELLDELLRYPPDEFITPAIAVYR